jgi:sphingomyelin phosphodiesterase acid-like 3
MKLPFIFAALTIFVNLCYCKKILQISDFHFDIDYYQFGDIDHKCHKNLTFPTEEDIGFYGNYMCDAPKSLVKHALTSAQQILPNPEFILWTGDNVPHIDNYTDKYVLDAINTTTSLMYQFFPNTQVLPLFGNHDYAPANAFPDYETSIYTVTFELWKKWIGESQRETFCKGGYYIFRPPNSNITFLMLNTNIYYRFNKAKFLNSTDPGQQFEFMEKVLSDAKSKGEMVHIVSHIPPGVFERTPNFTWLLNKYNKKFLQITVKYSTTIKWMLFGHHHTDTFHILKDNNKNPVQVMLMAPAVTPWFSDLEGAGSNNPSFRIIDYDSKTWDYNEIYTYYVNLTQLNLNHSTQWELEYSMKKDYNLDAIDGPSMNNLLETMKKNDTMLLKYIKYNSVLWNPELPKGKFRNAQLCSIEYPDLDEYAACMNKGTKTENFLTFWGIAWLTFVILT